MNKLENIINKYIKEEKEIELLDIIFLEFTGYQASDKEVRQLNECDSKYKYFNDLINKFTGEYK